MFRSVSTIVIVMEGSVCVMELQPIALISVSTYKAATHITVGAVDFGYVCILAPSSFS